MPYFRMALSLFFASNLHVIGIVVLVSRVSFDPRKPARPVVGEARKVGVARRRSQPRRRRRLHLGRPLHGLHEVRLPALPVARVPQRVALGVEDGRLHQLAHVVHEVEEERADELVSLVGHHCDGDL